MSQEVISQLTNRWINDPDLGEELRADPRGTFRRSGAQPDPEELEALRWNEVMATKKKVRK